MMFKPMRLVIKTVAVAKARARVTRKGFAYTPAKTKNFENEVRAHWKIANHPMAPKCATAVVIELIFPRPKSVKKHILLPITRPDLDNLTKGILDALNGHAWADDGQITDLQVYKRYGESGKISILIEPVVAA